MRTRTKILLGALALIICAGGAATLWLFSVSGTLCIARTGIEPSSRYADDALLRTDAAAFRTRAVDALARAFEPETGFFVYGLSPDGTRSSGNNDIRQLLASRVIALEAERTDSLRQIHEENLQAIFRDWYREEGSAGYVYAYEKSKLGANAMLLRVLVASPFFDTYKGEARKLVLGIMVLQDEDGSFEPWFREPGYTYDKDYLLTFYSGEAILALLEYAEKTGDSLARGIAERAQEFYIGEYVERIDENYYPAYVPWHTLSLSMLYEETKEKRYADAIFTMTDKLLELQDTTEFIGRFYNPATPEYGAPHASSDAVYTEGLATAYWVAKQRGDAERTLRYHEAITRAYAHLTRLEFQPSLFRVFDNEETAERLAGGTQTGLCDSNVRVDSTAHTVDALSATLRALE